MPNVFEKHFIDMKGKKRNLIFNIENVQEHL